MAQRQDSKKHRDFVGEPMGDKSVDKLPGISDVLKADLVAKGISKAYQVVGQFLILEKNEDKFMEWLKLKCPANSKQRRECCNAVKDWCSSFT